MCFATGNMNNKFLHTVSFKVMVTDYSARNLIKFLPSVTNIILFKQRFSVLFSDRGCLTRVYKMLKVISDCQEYNNLQNQMNGDAIYTGYPLGLEGLHFHLKTGETCKCIYLHVGCI